MKTFDLVVDEKVAVWRRSDVKVEAESLEKAINRVKYGADSADEIVDSEYICESEEFLGQSCEHPSTIEVMDANYNILYTNEI